MSVVARMRIQIWPASCCCGAEQGTSRLSSPWASQLNWTLCCLIVLSSWSLPCHLWDLFNLIEHPHVRQDWILILGFLLHPGCNDWWWLKQEKKYWCCGKTLRIIKKKLCPLLQIFFLYNSDSASALYFQMCVATLLCCDKTHIR